MWSFTYGSQILSLFKLWLFAEEKWNQWLSEVVGADVTYINIKLSDRIYNIMVTVGKEHFKLCKNVHIIFITHFYIAQEQMWQLHSHICIRLIIYSLLSVWSKSWAFKDKITCGRFELNKMKMSESEFSLRSCRVNEGKYLEPTRINIPVDRLTPASVPIVHFQQHVSILCIMEAA